MKKIKQNFLVILLTVLILSITFGVISIKSYAVAEAFSFETDITNKWGNWSFSNNTAVATNENSGNEFIVSKYNAKKQQDVIMKADVTFQAGGGTGFAFGMANKDDPGNSWYSLNLYRDNETAIYLRFFAVNVENSIGDTHNYRYDLTQQEIANGTFNIELRITGGGTLRGFLNGKCVVAVHDSGYNGGYLGFLTFLSSVTYENVEVQVNDAPNGTDTETDSQGKTTLNPLNNIKNEWGEWNKDSEKFTANNLVWYNQFAMTDIMVNPGQDLIFEADLTRLSNSNCAMLVFGVNDNSDPGRGWYALNLQEIDGVMTTRLYESNKGSIGEDLNTNRKNLTDEEKKIKSHNLRIEAYANGKICAYFDGVEFTQTYDSFYNGGYIGFGTFYGAYMFDNIKYKISDSNDEGYSTNGEQNFNPMKLRSKFTWANWTFNDNTIIANNSDSGNQFAMSSLYVSRKQNFTMEADLIMTGNSAGIAFGINQINDPINGWYALVVSRENGNARVFSENKGNIGIASKNVIDLTPEQKGGATIKIRIEVYSSGLIKAWVDEKQICNEIDAKWDGGYIGFNTFFATATFTNVKYSISNNDSLLNDLTVEGYNLDFDSNKKGYVLEVLKDVKNVKITANAKNGYNVKINGQSVNVLNYDILKAKSVISVQITDSFDNVVSIYDLEIKRFFNEQYRPSYHFTEKATWINDPNGLVYDETTDTYHMFYQYCEGVNNDGVFYWGHATSSDLVNWERKNPAIAPDQNGIIFSGSCVIDENNESGLFADNVPRASRLVALFTYHSDNPSIGLAYSIDFGETWIKYGKVIANENNIYGNHFRDPKVIRVNNEWLMITGGWTNVRLFSSTNLTEWTFNSEVMDFLNKNLQSECPDIFPLTLDGDESNVKWVISTGGTSYIIGSLDKINGKYIFTCETPGFKMFNSPDLWSNCGEVYATQSYYNDKLNRRILVSWMVDRTANVIEDKSWNGAQSLPLETDLITKNGMIVMRAYPVKEVESLRGKELLSLSDVEINQTENTLNGIQTNCFDLELELQVGNAKNVTFAFCKGENEQITLIYNVKNRVLALNTINCGKIESYKLSSSVTVKNGIISLRLLMDKSIIELFANDGEQSFHSFVFPSESSTSMSISCDEGRAKIISLTVWSMNDIH